MEPATSVRPCAHITLLLRKLGYKVHCTWYNINPFFSSSFFLDLLCYALGPVGKIVGNTRIQLGSDHALSLQIR